MSQLPPAIDGFIRTQPSDAIPQATQRMAALLLMDTIGIAAAATPMEAGVLGRETAFRLYGAGTPQDSAWMMFDGRSASLAGAAFAGATQTDNLDGHDGYNPTKGHIGVAVVPALVTLAQHLPKLSAQDALAALVISYEIAGRAGIALHNSVADYHTSGAWNALGVVAMGARLRGQSSEQLRQGLGIAEYHGPRSQMMREIASPTMLHDGSGMGALVGMSSLVMAEMGFTGAPAITVEAPEAAAHWADLGTLWQTDLQYIKPYPICRWAHAAIDAADGLRRAHGLTHDQITRIEINTFANAVALFPGMPPSTSEAQYSLPFAVGTILKHGFIGLPEISGDGLRDPDVARLVGCTHLAVAPHHDTRYPIGRWADVSLTVNDGRVLQSGDVHASGGPEDPWDEAKIIAKFMAFATPVLGAPRAGAIRDACLGLSDGGSFAAVLAHLRAPL